MKMCVHFTDGSSLDLGEVPDEIKMDKQLIYENIMKGLNEKNVDLHSVLIDSVNINYVHSN